MELDDIRPYFNLTAEEAARILGLSTIKLRKISTRLGIKKWPYRRIKSILNMIHVFKYLIHINKCYVTRRMYFDKLVQLIPIYEKLIETGNSDKVFFKTIIKNNHKLIKKHVDTVEFKQYVESTNTNIKMSLDYILN